VSHALAAALVESALSLMTNYLCSHGDGRATSLPPSLNLPPSLAPGGSPASGAGSGGRGAGGRITSSSAAPARQTAVPSTTLLLVSHENSLLCVFVLCAAWLRVPAAATPHHSSSSVCQTCQQQASGTRQAAQGKRQRRHLVYMSVHGLHGLHECTWSTWCTCTSTPPRLLSQPPPIPGQVRPFAPQLRDRDRRWHKEIQAKPTNLGGEEGGGEWWGREAAIERAPSASGSAWCLAPPAPPQCSCAARQRPP
jgi:hypothetical protein